MTQLAPHQQRVVDEQAELAGRLSKLLAFFQSPIFFKLDGAEQSRLRSQARFLTWPVPASVYPDGTPGQPGRTGTNLLSAEEARLMLQHVLGG